MRCRPGCAPGGAPTFLARTRKLGKRSAPHWQRPFASLRATCGARGRGALRNWLRGCAVPLRQPQRVRSRSECILRCIRSPRPLRSSAQPEGWGNPNGPSLRSALDQSVPLLRAAWLGSLPRWGRVGVGANRMSIGNDASPHPCLPPTGEGEAAPSPQPSPASGRGGKKPRPSAAMARVDFKAPLAVPRSAGRGAGMGSAACPCFVL